MNADRDSIEYGRRTFDDYLWGVLMLPIRMMILFLLLPGRVWFWAKNDSHPGLAVAYVSFWTWAAITGVLATVLFITMSISG